jgi:cytochrome c oxidase cbb3-type subunit 3
MPQLTAHVIAQAAGVLCATGLALGYASAARAAHDGASLYAQHCSACHGADGHGGVGVPIALPDFLATVNDRYLHLTVRYGRPGRVMPPFTYLSDAEINAIVKHIRTWQQGERRPLVKVGKGDVAKGEKLFKRNCAACHGPQGEGGRGTGVTFSRPRDLPVLAPALNNPGFHVAADAALIKATLMYGRDGTPMSSFLKMGLSEPDIDDVVAFVRSLGQKRAPSSAKLLDTESAVLMRQSPHDVATTVAKVKSALSAANMSVIRAVAFDEGLVDKKQENPKRVIIDGCDFNFLNQALTVDPRVGLFLPCRITVTEQAGRVLVMAVNPKRLSVIFNNSELNAMCEQMHEVYVQILEEATL